MFKYKHKKNKDTRYLWKQYVPKLKLKSPEKFSNKNGNNLDNKKDVNNSNKKD